jgi:signal transduction histidine kinase
MSRPVRPGLPRPATALDAPDHRLGRHLLEALDSLDAVYASAAFFAGIAAEEALGDYTLDRCLQALQCDCGAIYLVQDGGLRLHAERNGATAALRADLVPATLPTGQPLVHAGTAARQLLHAEAADRNLLTCPIHVGAAQLGLIVVLAPADQPFTAADVKLVTAVTSQAAIAISRTEHHRQVEIERRKLEQVIENHSDGIAVLDKDGNTTLCNPIARELLGTDQVLPLFGAIDRTCDLAALARADGERELTVTAGGTTRVIGVTSREVRTSTGELANVILTLRDLTRRRREDRLKRDFLSLLSHKFRTPLTALICGLEIMQSAEPEDRELFLQEVGQRTRDLRVLVDRLLYFAELLEGSWSTTGTTHLGELGEDLQRQFRPQKGMAGVEIVWDLAEDAQLVPAPPSRLRVALINLIDNAIKFAANGRPWVRIGSRRHPNGDITIEVEDRGPGIPATEREQLFGLFHQRDEDFTGAVAGAGIGLAMVQEITSRLGGRLELRDARPQGCIFALTFPPRAGAGATGCGPEA